MSEPHPSARSAWVRVLLPLLIFLGLTWSLRGGTGLVRTVYGPMPDRLELAVARMADLTLPEVSTLPGEGAAGVSVVWRGVWEVPADGAYDLGLDAEGHVTWGIDGALAHEAATGHSDARTVWLEKGFHEVEITYDLPTDGARLSVTAAPTGQPLTPLETQELKPRLPRNPRLRHVTIGLRPLAGVVVIVALLVAIRRTAGRMLARWFPGGVFLTRPTRWGRYLAWLLLLCAMLYGAVLRIDAITARFGPVSAPAWLAAFQTRTTAAPEAIRPSRFAWEPAGFFPHRDGPPTHYMSDPYTYLEYARAMRTFYEAHYREPVFTFTTKVFLGWLGNQDVAVSFASTFWSVLAILGTYVLGSAIWSRPVGLLAAATFAVDYDVVTLASLGWRDDAYIAAVAFTLCLFVHYWRMASSSLRIGVGRWRVDAGHAVAIGLGVVAGFAILVRIMAASFVFPGLAMMAVTMPTSWRRRWTLTAAATLAIVLVAGPYFYNCWRVYGDPLYAFNVHGNIYSMAEGRGETHQGTVAYVVAKLQSRPYERLETILQGVTTYPFTNKWHGLDHWHDALGTWASIAGMAGLVLLAATARGRLAIGLTLAALLPFSFTWRTDPSLRFTMFVYPFLLVAMATAINAAAWVPRALLLPGGVTFGFAPRTLRPWAAMMAGATVLAWVLVRVLPSHVFAEALAQREDATINAATSGPVFLGSDWSALMGRGNVQTRITMDAGQLWIYVPWVDDYPMTLRLDPFPRPLESAPLRLPTVDVSLNGQSVGAVPLQWSPDRVGSYGVVLPRTVVKAGRNELRLTVHRAAEAPRTRPGLSDGAAVSLWYARVHPPALARP